MTKACLNCLQMFDELLQQLLFASLASTESEEIALDGSKGKVWVDEEDFWTMLLIKFWSCSPREKADSPLIRNKTDNFCLLGLQVGWSETGTELIVPQLLGKEEF